MSSSSGFLPCLSLLGSWELYAMYVCCVEDMMGELSYSHIVQMEA